MRHSFLPTASRQQGQSNIEMAVGIALIQPDCLSDQIDRRVEPAGSVREETEQVNAGDVVWLGRKDGAAQPLGFSKIAGLHAFDGRREQWIHSGSIHRPYS